MTLSIFSLNDDSLSTLLATVPSDDLLPTGLTCKQLAAVCGARADRERSDGAPRWGTSITSSITRVKWAIANGAGAPTVKWCAAAAARGDLAVLQWVRLYGTPWDYTVCSSAAEHGHLHVLH